MVVGVVIVVVVGVSETESAGWSAGHSEGGIRALGRTAGDLSALDW